MPACRRPARMRLLQAWVQVSQGVGEWVGGPVNRRLQWVGAGVAGDGCSS